MPVAALIPLFLVVASPEPTTPPQSDGEPAAEKPFDFDLDLKPPPAPSAAESRAIEEAVALRRTMLTLHQGLGLAMLASLAATSVLGNLDLYDQYGGGGDTQRFHKWHVGLVIGSSALFAATGTLALLAPVPFPRPLRLDTVMLHRLLMGGAVLGMAVDVLAGLLLASLQGHLSQVVVVDVHQAIGYATLGLCVAGAAVFVF